MIIDASRSGASRATGRLKDGGVMQSVLPADYRDAIAAMQDKLVDIEIRDASSRWLPLLGNADMAVVLGARNGGAVLGGRPLFGTRRSRANHLDDQRQQG